MASGPELVLIIFAMASGLELGASADALLSLVRRVSAADGFDAGPLQADCLRLARKVSLLSYLLEEIRDSVATVNPTPPSSPVASSSSRISPSSFLADLTAALEAVERFLLLSCWSLPADASSMSPRPQSRPSSLPSSPPPHLPRPSSLSSSSQVLFGLPRRPVLPSQ